MISQNKTDKFNSSEIGVILIHISMSLFFWISYNENWIPTSQLKVWISGYYGFFPLLLLIISFRLLRRLKYYFIWIGIGTFQLALYFLLKTNSNFFITNLGSAFGGLRSLLPVLILFQIFRQHLKKKYDLDFIISIGASKPTLYEEEEHRNALWIEVTYSIFLMFTSFLFSVI